MSGVGELAAAIVTLKKTHDAIQALYTVIDTASNEAHHIADSSNVVERMKLSLRALEESANGPAMGPSLKQYVEETSCQIKKKAEELEQYFKKYKKWWPIRRKLRAIVTPKKPAEDKVQSLCDMMDNLRKDIGQQVGMAASNNPSGLPVSDAVAHWNEQYIREVAPCVEALHHKFFQAEHDFKAELKANRLPQKYQTRYTQNAEDYLDRIRNQTIIWNWRIESKGAEDVNKEYHLLKQFLRKFSDVCLRRRREDGNINSTEDLYVEEYAQELGAKFPEHRIRVALETGLLISRVCILNRAKHCAYASYGGIIWICAQDAEILRTGLLSDPVDQSPAQKCLREIQTWSKNGHFGTIAKHYVSLVYLFGLHEDLGCWLYPDVPDEYLIDGWNKAEFERALFNAGIKRKGGHPSLEDQVGQLKRQKQHFQGEKQELERRNKDLEQAQQQWQGEKEELERRNEELEQAQQQLQREKEELERRNVGLEQAKQQLHGEKQEIERSKIGLETQRRQFRSRIGELKLQTQYYQSRSEDLERAQEQLQGEKRELERKNADLQTESNQGNCRLGDLEAMLRSNKEQIEKKEVKALVEHRSIEELQEENTKLKAFINEEIAAVHTYCHGILQSTKEQATKLEAYQNNLEDFVDTQEKLR